MATSSVLYFACKNFLTSKAATHGDYINPEQDTLVLALVIMFMLNISGCLFGTIMAISARERFGTSSYMAIGMMYYLALISSFWSLFGL